MKINIKAVLTYIVSFAIILCSLFMGLIIALNGNFPFIDLILNRAIEIVLLDSGLLIIIALIILWNSRNK